MAIKQISVFVENKPGRLADITGFLADGGISIRAFSIADTTDLITELAELTKERPGSTELYFKVRNEDNINP